MDGVISTGIMVNIIMPLFELDERKKELDVGRVYGMQCQHNSGYTHTKMQDG